MIETFVYKVLANPPEKRTAHGHRYTLPKQIQHPARKLHAGRKLTKALLQYRAPVTRTFMLGAFALKICAR